MYSCKNNSFKELRILWFLNSCKISSNTIFLTKFLKFCYSIYQILVIFCVKPFTKSHKIHTKVTQFFTKSIFISFNISMAIQIIQYALFEYPYNFFLSIFLLYIFILFFLFNFNHWSSLFWSFFPFNSFKSFSLFTSVTFSRFFATNIHTFLPSISFRCSYIALSKLFKNILNKIESIHKLMSLALK